MMAALARLRRDESGSTTIEFCILFPVFIAIFGSSFEAGLLNTRHAMLERATDLAVRELRLGEDPTPTFEELRANICNYAAIIPDCDEALHVELETISTDTWQFRTGDVQCVDREEEITPAVQFNAGTINELMLVTVCAVFETMIPTTGLGLKLPKVSGNDYALIAKSAFVNEP
ncbi:TadE/TadG family type IV pilus assembly protein [Pseudoruegeria sp. HB172150]|uniref:TadE/TadG family type IV pilus assembly protein n=1 Tax=Pseudoruegeria sp. HB172150 TaxID=2721164 RepID=UPI0015568067|nr:TadE/TadG family type IV pilus assembly protein [Pseudoruegeria sp. HB172150]